MLLKKVGPPGPRTVLCGRCVQNASVFYVVRQCPMPGSAAVSQQAFLTRTPAAAQPRWPAGAAACRSASAAAPSSASACGKKRHQKRSQKRSCRKSEKRLDVVTNALIASMLLHLVVVAMEGKTNNDHDHDHDNNNNNYNVSDDDDNDNDNDNDKWKDQRRRLDSFENEREMNKLLGGPKTKIQRLKDMRRMRRAALRESPPARRILQDPKGAWVLIVVLIILTLLGVHYFCDTWIEALTLLVFVTVVTLATATIQ